MNMQTKQLGANGERCPVVVRRCPLVTRLSQYALGFFLVAGLGVGGFFSAHPVLAEQAGGGSNAGSDNTIDCSELPEPCRGLCETYNDAERDYRDKQEAADKAADKYNNMKDRLQRATSGNPPIIQGEERRQQLQGMVDAARNEAIEAFEAMEAAGQDALKALGALHQCVDDN